MSNNHLQNLQQFCRSCGSKIKTSKHYINPKPIAPFSAILKKYYDVHLESDQPSIHPPNVCQKCYLKFYKLEKKDVEDEIVVKQTLFQFEECGNSCKICIPSVVGRPSSKEKSKADVFAELKNSIYNISVKYPFQYFQSENQKLLHFYSVQNNEDKLYISFSFVVNIENGEWNVFVGEKMISNDHTYLNDIPKLVSVSTIEQLFKRLSSMKICPGNDDFEDLLEKRFNVQDAFLNVSGEEIAVIECHQGHSIKNAETIRHKNCDFLIDKDILRCATCSMYRSSLRAMKSRKKSTEVKDSTNDRYLSHEQLLEKLNKLEKQKKNLSRKLLYCQNKVKKLIKRDGVNVTDEMHGMLSDVIGKEQCPFEENTPQALLWQQQLKQTKQDKRGMRWHPLIIRWCLSIYLKSPSTYRQIQRSLFLNLPCKNTLLKYINFTDPASGFNPDIIKQLGIEVSNINEHGHKKICSVIFDEMKIKSGIVFCKTTGKLVGFTDLGSINNLVDEFNRDINQTDETEDIKEIASYVIVFLVRGVFSNLCFPFGHFSSGGFTGEQIYHTTWEAISILEGLGLEVRAVIADGASPNRKFFKLHKYDDSLNKNIFWAWNECASNRKVFFFCDVPHLIKTTRNNLENSHWNMKTRHLVLDGQQMGWNQIANLYEWDTLSTSNSAGLRYGHKLREEHIYLNPNTRMRVNLAAQVLSSTVVHMLEEQGFASTTSLRKFITMVDKFFDCMNVSKLLNTTRKPELNVYRTQTDWRFRWLQEIFMKFLDDWEQEAHKDESHSKDEQNRRCLSKQTLEGLRITVNSFTTLAPLLLNEYPDVFLMSEKFSQDPVEEYFSRQRQRCGANENPSLQEFNRNFVALTVTGNELIRVFSGNTRGRQREQTKIDIDDKTLPPAAKKKYTKP